MPGKGITASGGASEDVRRLLRRMLRELCTEDSAGEALEWARRIGIEHGPLDYWRQQLRERGIQSVQDFQAWITRRCASGEYSKWPDDGTGGPFNMLWTPSGEDGIIRTSSE